MNLYYTNTKQFIAHTSYAIKNTAVHMPITFRISEEVPSYMIISLLIVLIGKQRTKPSSITMENAGLVNNVKNVTAGRNWNITLKCSKQNNVPH